MKRTCYVLFALLPLVWPFVLLAGCQNSKSATEPKPEAPQAKSVKISVVTVEPAVIKDVLVLPGETEAWEDIRLASDIAGIVEWIGPREGQEVKKEQLIARIDVSALKAKLDQAKASLDLANRLYERRKLLLERNVIAKEEFDRSLNERVLAETALRQAEVEYERGFLKSPIHGLVNYVHVDIGEYVDRGEPVADVVNVVKIKIHVNVPELDVRYLRVGQQGMVTIDAFPGRQLPGTIDFVPFKADPVTKTFRARVLVSNTKRDIRPGMIARVAFLRRMIPDALVVPLFALVDKGGERMLFVEKDGIAHGRNVAIGIVEGDRVQITKGLEVGDHLIVTGQKEVEEGMKVEVQ